MNFINFRARMRLYENHFFLTIGTTVIPIDAIQEIDISEIEQLKISILHGGRWTVVAGIPAIDTIYSLKPSALEGRRFRWIRNAWAFHNLVAHPLMQILVFFKQHALAMRIHDATVPRPLGTHTRT